MTQERDKVFMINPNNKQNVLEIDLADDTVKELKIGHNKLEAISVDDNGCIYATSTDGHIYITQFTDGKMTLKSFKLKDGTFAS